MARCGSGRVPLVSPIRRQMTPARASFRQQCPSGQNLLQSLVKLDGARVQHLKMEARNDSAKGRGLYAVEDVAPGELLLDVPWGEVFSGDGAVDGPWGAEMGVKLAKLHKQESRSEVCGAWLESLPRDPLFPPLAFSGEELSAILDETTRTEALNIGESMRDAFEELPTESGISWDIFYHAVSVLHGRCFCVGETHVTVPGIDLANHSFDPSARVNILNSPDLSQGLSASEEVCDPPKSKVSTSVMQLIANESGIKRGDEITISYGSWPNDVLFLLFGFVVPDNPNDVAVIFMDEFDLLDFLEELVIEESSHFSEYFSEIRSMTEEWCSQQEMDFGRMVVSYEGIDGRIGPIMESFHTNSKQVLSSSEESISAIPPAMVVHRRCDGLLQAFENDSAPEAKCNLIRDLNLAKETLLRAVVRNLTKRRTA
ncbi:hypothetical protein BSKO_03919 [Bryopsis sp. KO-2023]|nr:hypothetical protein BSKO_03919 [Bryopsis sp. KO-2023]